MTKFLYQFESFRKVKVDTDTKQLSDSIKSVFHTNHKLTHFYKKSPTDDLRKFFKSRSHTLKINYFHEYSDLATFDAWCEHIRTLGKEKGENPLLLLTKIEHQHFGEAEGWANVLLDLASAINEHEECKSSNPLTAPLSLKSTCDFLLLVPILANHHSRVHIDSRNGFVNVDISTRDDGVLSAQVSEGGQIQYSYVGKRAKIFKISGTAKFKDDRDYIKFNKILRLI